VVGLVDGVKAGHWMGASVGSTYVVLVVLRCPSGEIGQAKD